jgi:hypothetical protein
MDRLVSERHTFEQPAWLNVTDCWTGFSPRFRDLGTIRLLYGQGKPARVTNHWHQTCISVVFGGRTAKVLALL